MNGRDKVMQAFDRLFNKAATKLAIRCDDAERTDARQKFEERFSPALEWAEQLPSFEIPPTVMQSMEEAIDHLSPADIAAHVASLPLAHQAQRMMQSIAVSTAEQRLLDQLIGQADDAYGGN